MEALAPLFNMLTSKPELFPIALLLFMWYSERTERQAQQKANTDLTDKMMEFTVETKSTLTEMNTLLQILTRGRHT